MKNKAIFLSLLFVFLMFFSCSNQANLEESAIPIVNQLLEEHYGKDNYSVCLKVVLGEEFADNNYHATVILQNGGEIDVTIEDQGEHVVVRMTSF
jgi:hypothetical protein